MLQEGGGALLGFDAKESTYFPSWSPMCQRAWPAEVLVAHPSSLPISVENTCNQAAWPSRFVSSLARVNCSAGVQPRSLFLLQYLAHLCEGHETRNK